MSPRRGPRGLAAFVVAGLLVGLFPSTGSQVARAAEPSSLVPFGWAEDFVALGRDHVWLKSGVVVNSGDVGANGTAPSGGPTVEIDQSVRVVDAQAEVFGDAVDIDAGAQVRDVYTNRLSGAGTILGQTKPARIPVVGNFHAMPTVQPGSVDRTIAKNGTLTLAAGRYRNLAAGRGSTLVLSGGLYHFNSWDIGADSRILFRGPTEVRLAGRVIVGSNGQISPDAAGLLASDLLLVSGASGATPAMDIKGGTRVAAWLQAPNGTILIDTPGTVSGSLAAARLTIAQNTSLTHVAIDPARDADGDGVPDRLERRIGSSPFSTDSDGDGLTDGFETLKAFLAHEPTKPDTDADGQPDPGEDFDGDGLTALEEQTRGTDPLEEDGDGDGLSDPAEISVHGTDPNRHDTDDDALDDGAEIRMGTDPLDPDSDDDGILDGTDILTVVLPGPGGVSVELRGTGDLAAALTIVDRGPDFGLLGLAGQKGPVYDFRLAPDASVALTQAVISLPFDPSDPSVGDPNDLAIFVLNEETGQWEPAAAAMVVDPVAGVVRATVEHFSLYALFNLREWIAYWQAQSCADPDPDPGERTWVDVALIIDSSGSMTSNDPGNLRRTAAKDFVDLLAAPTADTPGDRGAVVDFDSSARLLQGLTTDKVALKAAIDRIDSSGGTNLAAGMLVGLNELTRETPDPQRQRVVIMLTDGEGFYDSNLTERAVDEDVVIFTIGLGTFIDEPLLRTIAETTGGRYFPAASADELEEIFEDIGGEIGEPDADGDGLTDCEETIGLVDGGGSRFTSDPNDEDTDDDGLPDGGEMYVSETHYGAVVVSVNVILADPRRADTDGDGVPDGEEIEAGSNARVMDTDGDGLFDSELSDGLDPLSPDTDLDGFLDGFETAQASQGFDPLFFDPPTTGASWSDDFTAGLIAGDADERDSVAWMLGSLASGYAVYGDVRDALVNVAQLDLVGFLVSAAGVIPLAGDVGKTVARVGEFIGRHADKADELFAAIARLDLIPREVKLAVLKAFRGPAFDTMRAKGISEDNVLKLARGRRGLDAIASNLNRLHPDKVKSAGRFFPGGRSGGDQAEGFLRTFFGVADNNKGIKSALSWRFPDVRVLDEAGQLALHEVKTGLARDIFRLRRQALKDADLLLNNPDVGSVTWHLFASDFSNSIGLDDSFFNFLTSRGIDIVIWTP